MPIKGTKKVVTFIILYKAIATDNSKNKPDYPGRALCIVKAIAGKGRLKIVACQHIKAYAVGNNEKN